MALVAGGIVSLVQNRDCYRQISLIRIKTAMPEILKNISQMKLRMRRGPVVFGEVVYAAGGICGPRIQHDYQLVILHRGKLDLRLDQRGVKVAARRAILLSPGHHEHFIFSRDSETHHSWCSIEPKAISSKLRKWLRSSCGVPASVDSRITSLMELGKTMSFEGQADSFLEHNFHLSLGLSLLTGFALGFQSCEPAPTSGEHSLIRAEQFILNEYGRHLTLADLAAAAGVSRQHLLKLFRQHRGCTPTQSLYERRLSAATEQLSHTGLPIREIAARCGFANEFHFSRKFKQVHGQSPRGWRSDKWKNSSRISDIA
jgi:AraC-like DNA-binding protein